MAHQRALPTVLLLILAVLLAPMAFAQQTGGIRGKVTASDGSALPGVTVEARSNVLPQPRTTVSDENGEFRLPALQPGPYTLTFTLSGLETLTRRALVQLAEETVVDGVMGMSGVSESITVVAEASLVDTQSTAIQSSVSEQQIAALPVGQDYRDLQKLIPGVMYTEDNVRGPSSGGSGQDNVYQIDGVKVTLPQYGTLSAESSNQDVAQITVIKGGAKAIDFDRSGGFTIDSVSKSGTNKFLGGASYQIENKNFSSAPAIVGSNRFDENRAWMAANIGGPILRDRLFFYASYYRPERDRDNRSNNYGELPDYAFQKDEIFGKLTYTPTASILLNGSYRDSKTVEASTLFGGSQAPSTGTGSEATLRIGLLEGSWIINNRSYATFKLSDFQNLTASRPDVLTDVRISTAVGTQLDLANLDQIGRLTVPCPNNRPTGAPCVISASTQPGNAFNTFISPFIDRYGYVANNQRVGGGLVGVGTTIDNDDFFRTTGQIGYNLTLGSNIAHDIHVGYQQFADEEDLLRSTNGWGDISIQGGTSTCPATVCGTAQPVFFTANFSQQSIGTIPAIHSEYKSKNFEINDSIRMANWHFNIGVIASQDTLYGAGLAPANNAAGYVKSIGSSYKMYEIPWSKLIQPRLGATWAYNGSDTVYASYSASNPAVSSLPRAASFDRGNNALINAFFDANGRLIGVAPTRSSNGKLFVEDMDPRRIDEYLIGTAQKFTGAWSARFYARHRHATNFWEDTPNNARINCGIEATVGGVFDPVICNPPSNVPRKSYIADLPARITAIGAPTATYVIAELDGAFTKFYEATIESDWNRGNKFLRGSYTWSHYYGNYDQDNSTVQNDANVFVGSSNIADAPGRQIWDKKYGDLRGDRRHMLKVYGSYGFPWRGALGGYAVYQSGQPWEAWNYEIYRPLVGTSTSDTIRNSEPAGARRTPAHHQIDLKYTQGIPAGPLNVEFIVDFFNVYNRRTGYSYQPSTHLASFGQPRLAYNPRRFQLTAKVQF